MNLDLINGLFEIMAGLMILNNCRVLAKQKHVSGVSVISTAFFFLWGLWNLHYYPSLGQTYSYFAGMLIAVANLIWVVLMLKYRSNKNLIGAQQ